MYHSTHSIWVATTPETHYPSLTGDIRADVAIVGGGIAGLTAAYLLKRRGKSVAVIEKSKIAMGETGFTTAHLTEALDSRYKRLIFDYGEKGARIAAESSRASIVQIASIVAELNIACGFKRLPGYLYTETPQDTDDLKEELAAARGAGVTADWVEVAPVPFANFGGIRFEAQAQFHPRKYLLPLAKAIDGDGCHVFENSKAEDMKDGEPCEVVCEGGRVIANEIIVAANTPINNRVFIHTKMAAYRTYVIGAGLKPGITLPGLFWDTADPYHYIRTQTAPDGGEILIVGGEDHKTGTQEHTCDNFDSLEAYMRTRFDVGKIQYCWSGQIMEPCDGLPYIGRNSLAKHVYVASGFSGNGMTFGTLSGMLLADEILGMENPWAKLFNATRIKPVASATEYVSENKDFPMYFVGDRIAPAEAQSLTEVQSDEGKIVRIDGRKVAVYRDEHGEVHACDPVCPHLGCHVHYNDAEKTWDCPCHGSRFDSTGKVLNGPATSDLKRVDVHEPAKA